MTLDEWCEKYTDEDGNIEGWTAIYRVLDDGHLIDTRLALVMAKKGIDAIEIKGARVGSLPPGPSCVLSTRSSRPTTVFHLKDLAVHGVPLFPTTLVGKYG